MEIQSNTQTLSNAVVAILAKEEMLNVDGYKSVDDIVMELESDFPDEDCQKAVEEALKGWYRVTNKKDGQWKPNYEAFFKEEAKAVDFIASCAFMIANAYDSFSIEGNDILYHGREHFSKGDNSFRFDTICISIDISI